MAKIAEGALYKFRTGDIVDADVAPQGGALNPIFETIRIALNDTDARIDGVYTKAQVDAMVQDIQSGSVVDNSITNIKLGPDVKIGSLAALTTTDKLSITNAINEVAAKAAAAVSSTNGVMTGNLTIQKIAPIITLRAMGSSSNAGIRISDQDEEIHWQLVSGVTNGSPGPLTLVNGAGTTVISIDQSGRITGITPTAGGHLATKDYVDTSVHAARIPIDDDGGFYKSTFIEGALSEIAKTTNQLSRVTANLTALAEINEQSIGQSGYAYDLFLGPDENTFSAAVLDMSRATVNGTLAAGSTQIPIRYLEGTFLPGQEVTIQDLFTESKRETAIVQSLVGTNLTLVSATVNLYDDGATIYRSLVEVDTVNQKLKFGRASEADPAWGITKLANPAVDIPDSGYTMSFSPDMKYLVACSINVGIFLYKHEKGVLTWLGDNGIISEATGFTGMVTWTPDSQYFAVSTDDTPHIWIYKKTSDVQFTKLADPASLPPWDSEGCDYSSDGTYLAVSNYTGSPHFRVYKRNGDTYTKLADPALMPGQGYAIKFSPDMVHLMFSSNDTEGMYVYKRSGDTFTKLDTPFVGGKPNAGAAIRRHGIAFTSDSQYMACGINLTWYKRSGDTYTKLTNPTTMPAGLVNSLVWSPDNKYLYCAHNNSPYITIYQRSGDTLTKLANPSVLPDANGNGVTITSDGRYVVLGLPNTALSNIVIFSTEKFTDLKTVDVRYNVTPPTGIMDELRSWIQYDDFAGFSITSSLSIHDTAGNESYQFMDGSTLDLGTIKEQYAEGFVVSPQEKCTQKIRMTRANTTDNVAIKKYLAAIIAP